MNQIRKSNQMNQKSNHKLEDVDKYDFIKQSRELALSINRHMNLIQKMVKESNTCDKDWTYKLGIPSITDAGLWYRIKVQHQPTDEREPDIKSSTAQLLCINPHHKICFASDVDFAKQLLGGSIHTMVTERLCSHEIGSTQYVFQSISSIEV